MFHAIPEEIKDARELAEKMIKSADRNEMDCTDDKCFLLYALIRDCGYQVKKLIEAGGTNQI